MKQYVVDAFTDEVFRGNQAAVCILDEWPSEELMMNITRENNFSETAFAVKNGDKYALRWFTPGGEIDLCGHSTLATAFVLFQFDERGAEKLVFESMSGDLTVTRRDGALMEMEFPAFELKKARNVAAIGDALGVKPVEVWLGRDLLCVYDDEEIVRALKPDFTKLESLKGAIVHATAPGKDVDCVSRSFAPKFKVPEDPVCGSGHCHIAPYWSQKTGKQEIVAYQASPRGGTLYCRVADGKVYISGKAALFSMNVLCMR